MKTRIYAAPAAKGLIDSHIIQTQTAVTAYFACQQLLPFGFAKHNTISTPRFCLLPGYLLQASGILYLVEIHHQMCVPCMASQQMTVTIGPLT